MANTPCTIKNITLIEVSGGVRYTGPVDREGLATNNDQGEADFSDDMRIYFCNNCMTNFNGEETFDEVVKHLGTFPLDE